MVQTAGKPVPFQQSLWLLIDKKSTFSFSSTTTSTTCHYCVSSCAFPVVAPTQLWDQDSKGKTKTKELGLKTKTVTFKAKTKTKTKALGLKTKTKTKTVTFKAKTKH